MSDAVKRAVAVTLAGSALPASLADLDPQGRRKVETEARWHKSTPEAYYRDSLAARRTSAELDDVTSKVLAAIGARR